MFKGLKTAILYVFLKHDKRTISKQCNKAGLHRKAQNWVVKQTLLYSEHSP